MPSAEGEGVTRIELSLVVDVTVTDAAALTEAALRVIDSTARQTDDPGEKRILADLRAAVPHDTTAAVIALVDPESPLAPLPGVTIGAFDVEVRPAEEQAPEIQLP